MPWIIGVKFRNVGKVYYFDPVDFTIRYHDHVIVETARGIEYGTVVLTRTEIDEEKLTLPLKPVLRMATEEDTAHEQENRQKEKEAYRICKQKIAEHNLDMKLIEAEYTFDGSKVLFYFTADGRIDFRDLVKDLAGIFRTRIELRQIGVRDETKILGGIGTCGRPLCCHTWLTEFAPVSIKMAKDQNLSLNPTKISGTCGRLMCCLKNEADTYAYLNKSLPNKGDYVTTKDGLHGDVQSVNILRQTVKVIVETGDDEKELQEFDVKDITFIPKAKKQKFLQEKQQKAEGKKPHAAAQDPDTEEQGTSGGKKNRKRVRQKPETAALGAGPKQPEAAGEAGNPQEEHGRDPEQKSARRPKKPRKHPNPAAEQEAAPSAGHAGTDEPDTAGQETRPRKAEGDDSPEAAEKKKRRRRRHHKNPKGENSPAGAQEPPAGSAE
ncbi:MAG: hypothetical protein J6E44_04995 [Lachnospiraceae bacterium]|nr:hypothetical protein [Lachnospiraceae bacterium]